MRTSEELKQISISEFTKAADKYESDNAGVYNTCKKNYPEVLAEIKKESFETLLDAGCGTGPMISLLVNDLPNKHYIGLDLTPKMIEVAKAKKLPNAEFIVGDCEDLPFDENTFDIVICCESFHHYPNKQAFFDSVYRVLKPNGRLILRDYMAGDRMTHFMNKFEMPLLNAIGHGDVGILTKNELKYQIETSGLTLEKLESRKHFKMHCVCRKK